MKPKTTKGRTHRKSSAGWRLHVYALAAILALVGIFAGYKAWYSDAVQMRFVYMWAYQQDIITYSKRNNIDPFLVAAIIKNESNFDHKAVSDAGAVGLMQIMPETGRWIAEQMGLADYTDDQLYTTRTNIRMGCWYISELEHEFKGNLTLLMIAYNAGRGQTKDWMEQQGWDYNFGDIKSIPYADTREYVTKVLHDRDEYYRLYRQQLGR